MCSLKIQKIRKYNFLIVQKLKRENTNFILGSLIQIFSDAAFTAIKKCNASPSLRGP